MRKGGDQIFDENVRTVNVSFNDGKGGAVLLR
jgi:hypothetical protein